MDHERCTRFGNSSRFYHRYCDDFTMAAPLRTKRRFMWSKWEHSGFPEKVNHAVASWTSDSDQSHFMYAIGGFEGRGNVKRGFEDWNDLGEIPLDMVRLDVGKSDIIGLIVCRNLSQISIESRQWAKIYPVEDEEKIHPSPTIPESTCRILSGRYAHSCCCYKGKLYMYGGRNDFAFCEGVECYDISESQFKLFLFIGQ